MYISNTNYTLTGFTQNRANTVIGGSRPWVAFGKQKQWGRLTTNNTGNITFPLSFSSFCAIALGTQSDYESTAAQSWNTYWAPKLNGFMCEPYDATYNAGKSYIAVGK